MDKQTKEICYKLEIFNKEIIEIIRKSTKYNIGNKQPIIKYIIERLEDTSETFTTITVEHTDVFEMYDNYIYYYVKNLKEYTNDIDECLGEDSFNQIEAILKLMFRLCIGFNYEIEKMFNELKG